ncbi:metallophosphoesterase family protein [Umezakia ovalisporum]|uniref:Metallophosphoesterase n=2 Tax=Umezakia ovalisporum TaxID=75695 RepID=A0AA43KFY5_9CYAN|nr:metallophosphoesterase [Umezakia ovalisporum]MDH6057102.1 metallophosphoesterase [Umezakia ovalisporum FSS-43]MDH6065051.1 metallophosphoesterase [Umezakia ovalisporum FSS-62]MDH6067166.1 metallophosphoesterase [Umezakia ovalisporum APH033B]MDH6071415.1 metallophosphoesterase [Umezakia ovalisporum CobakiLakeA]MDH6075006.1 metallophosphoesterase [Umezakia ovalisporum CS-1034]
MDLNFRFAIVSDLHITLPHTIWDHPNRFHLVEVSIAAFESVIEHLTQLNLDFLLLPGDLTQHSEPENHLWLQERLAKLPFPTYVVPGNHDVPVLTANEQSIGLADFPYYYRKFGYENPCRLYYTHQLLPKVRLIGLNSNFFNEEGDLIGRLDTEQLIWLEEVLAAADDELVMVMVHHNVVEHLPEQLRHPIGKRYILENSPHLLQILRRYGVKLVFTGHLHIQDIACSQGVYDITTGSLVSYPHPYRVLEFRQDNYGRNWLQIISHRIETLPDFPNLQHLSRQWMGDRSFPFLVKLLTQHPLNLPLSQAEKLAPGLRDFWANIADGDALLDYPQFPPDVRRHIQTYGARASGIPTLIDNHSTLLLGESK